MVDLGEGRGWKDGRTCTSCSPSYCYGCKVFGGRDSILLAVGPLVFSTERHNIY